MTNKKYTFEGVVYDSQPEYREALKSSKNRYKSYERWQDDEDLSLLELSNDLKVEDLADHFKRIPGSIRERLRHLKDERKEIVFKTETTFSEEVREEKKVVDNSGENKLESFNRIKESVLEALLSAEQQFIFVSGAAGTGKTTLIEEISREVNLNTSICAPTGVAALNVGGKTINSLFRLELGSFPKIKKYNNWLGALILENMELLIIDEISMVKASILDAISDVLKRYKKNSRPFGGIHLLVSGDLFQLPPIINTDEEVRYFKSYETAFFFGSQSFNQIRSKEYFLLKESFRQESDSLFSNLLNNVREGTDLSNTVSKINQNCFKPLSEKEGALILTAKRNPAEQINLRKLEQIDEEKIIKKAQIKGDFKESEMPAPEELILKKGAQVLFIKNDPESSWVNGTIGKVNGINKKKDILVEIDGTEVIVRRFKWEKKEQHYNEDTDSFETEVTGTFKQYPVILGWAVTIHRAQGLTLDSCVVDLGEGAFAAGQAYVALSRCKTLDSLILKEELEESDIKLDKEVIEFYLEKFY